MHSANITVSDGAVLHYMESGSGQNMLMLSGGGFAVRSFKHQIEHFSQKMHVIALDKRGHGDSEKVVHGYRIARFAKDLHDVIETLGLDNITLLAHSLGAAMVYAYIDLFGCDKLSKLIIVDEPPALLINPIWSEDERKSYGAIYDAASLHELTNGFVGDDVEALNQKIVDVMTTQYATEEQKAFLRGCIDIEGTAAQRLYLNNIMQDFRDVMEKITIPTLFITGDSSLHPPESHHWMHRKVPNSKLTLFSEKEGGNHFMFVENPEKFNEVVDNFISNS